ncbi:unnamed protein product, partial [Effrenium voratum]
QVVAYLRGLFFAGQERSFGLEVVRAVKFQVPSELRSTLPLAERAAKAWLWLEPDEAQVRRRALQALRLPALASRLGALLGLRPLLRLQRALGGVESARNAVEAAFQGVALSGLLEEWRQRLGGRSTPALRVVIKDSPGRLKMELMGSASWQQDGAFGLLGADMASVNLDTVGLLFNAPSAQKDGAFSVSLEQLPGNNLETAGRQVPAAVARVAEAFRRPLDPSDQQHAWELLGPGPLATLAELFPDGKYDVGLVQHTFEHFRLESPYALEETNWLDRIRGKPELCYLSFLSGRKEVRHLLKTQKHLDETRVQFYEKQLAEMEKSGSARPTALVVDFFKEGGIHDFDPSQPMDPGDFVALPGGRVRRRQRRRSVPGEAGYMDSIWTWVLLDGHHKVEAATRLGCSLNFLVFCPCAEPLAPLDPDDEKAPLLAKSAALPQLWPDGGPIGADWPHAEHCHHVAMTLSSARLPPQQWRERCGCGCYDAEGRFPRWALASASKKNPGVTREQIWDFYREALGAEHTLFTDHFNTDFRHLPQALQEELGDHVMQLYSAGLTRPF